jgi:hypothetical protein
MAEASDVLAERGFVHAALDLDALAVDHSVKHLLARKREIDAQYGLAPAPDPPVKGTS